MSWSKHDVAVSADYLLGRKPALIDAVSVAVLLGAQAVTAICNHAADGTAVADGQPIVASFQSTLAAKAVLVMWQKK